TIQAPMWDAEANYALAARCVKKSGIVTQIRFAVTHVVLLWGYNIIWPDQGRRDWGRTMEVSCASHNVAFLVPAVAAVLLALRRRRARSMLLACYVWSLVIASMLYFGDTRYRAPYDGLIIVLAMATYIDVGGLALRLADRIRDLVDRILSARRARG